jgi:hypothetical protein
MNDNLSPQFGSYDYHEAVAHGEHPPAMFATAKEIIKTHQLGDKGDEYTVKELLNEKLEEADARPGVGYDVPEGFIKQPKETRQSGWYGGLTKRIKKQGYDWSKPVELEASDPQSILHQGHHRVAVMRRDRPDEFFPLHYDKPSYEQ